MAPEPNLALQSLAVRGGDAFSRSVPHPPSLPHLANAIAPPSIRPSPNLDPNDMTTATAKGHFTHMFESNVHLGTWHGNQNEQKRDLSTILLRGKGGDFDDTSFPSLAITDGDIVFLLAD